MTLPILLGIFVVLCGMGILVALTLPSRSAPAIIAWIGAPAALALLGAGALALFSQVPFEAKLWSIASLGPISVRVDSLGGFFLLVTGFVLLPASVFASASLAALLGCFNLRAFAALYFALMAAIVGVLVAGDTFSFLFTWEIMSVLCYLLISFGCESEETPQAGYLMVALGETGALAAALGLLLLAAHAGSLDFAGMKTSGSTLGDSARWGVFLLTFFGFGVKAGLVPVNVWLPRAYAVAPSAFVPVLAGATLNLGLYGIFRVNADLLPAVSIGPGLLTLIVGACSAFLGILYATTENDLKTLLAHSSIENAGIVTAGMGAGFLFVAAHRPELAAIAYLVALYHLANHSFYKTLLFFGTGVVGERTGTRNLDRLGGLIRRMPWTAAFVLAGVLAISALPPFNGFVSEWLTLQTFLRSAELPSIGVKIVFALCGATLALTAALAVTCFVKFFAMGFLGMTRSPEAGHATDGPPAVLMPMAFLAALCLLLGVLPTYVIGALNHAVEPIAGRSAAAVLVPPFFADAPGHAQLPVAFASEFHDLGAQVGESIAPGSGLVIMHRGGAANPVVFAGAPTYLAVVLGGMLLLVFVLVWWTCARHRAVTRRACWDGGIQRLRPEMTYTATGFSRPVAVIFDAIFRPKVMEDTREMVAEHFRGVVRRKSETIYVVDRMLLGPISRAAMSFAELLARIHHGRLNVYLAYVLGALLAALLLVPFL